MNDRRLPAPALRFALVVFLLIAGIGPGRSKATPWRTVGAESLNVSVIGYYRVDSPTGIWSCAAYVHASGREYGLIGADSLHIIDLRIPSEPKRITTIPPARPPETGPYFVDIAVRGPYAYAAVRNGPILIVDLRNPFLPVVRGSIPRESFCACSCGKPCIDPDKATIETLFIDEAGILYVAGITCGEGFHMYDLAANEIDPPWLCHAHTHPADGTSYYAHYVYASDGLLFVSYPRRSEASPPRWDILDGTHLCPDFAGPCGDGERPALISSFSHEGEELHAHSAWRLQDPRYLLTCDEKRDGHVRIWDLGDLNAPIQIGTYHPDRTCHSVHEAVIKGEIGYAAWYNKGIQVFTLENPAHPLRIGFYSNPVRWRSGPEEHCCDPTDGPSANCSGVPMIDPFFPSGIFIAVDIEGGLLVGKFAYGPVGGPDRGRLESPDAGGRLRILTTPGSATVRIVWDREAGGTTARDAPLRLDIVSAGGTRVARVGPQRYGSAGAFEYRWDGRDESGRPLPSGVYFARPAGGTARGGWGKVILLD